MHLARCGRQGPVTAVELAGEAEAPANYMGKILHELVRRGVLKSVRGKRGGFELAVPPSELSLLTVVSPFHNLGEDRKCLLGRAVCSDRDPCAAHARWGEVADRIDNFFASTTVADVLEQ